MATGSTLASAASTRSTPLRHLILRESQIQPLLLILEDLHWIDAETQAWLDGLVDALPAARLLLLVTYRPEYQHAWGNRTYYTQLRVDPLPREGAEDLLQALVGADAELASLRALLIQRTDGNPFFLEESVRTLVETKALVGEPGAYRLAQALDHVQVPATVQAILASRIDRLPARRSSYCSRPPSSEKTSRSSCSTPSPTRPRRACAASSRCLQSAEFLV